MQSTSFFYHQNMSQHAGQHEFSWCKAWERVVKGKQRAGLPQAFRMTTWNGGNMNDTQRMHSHRCRR